MEEFIMTTINELINQITSDEHQIKTASDNSETDLNKIGDELGFKSEAHSDSVTKTASQEEGGQGMNLGLHTLYNDYFGDESEKTASIENENMETELEKTAAQIEENLGERTRAVVDGFLDSYIWKVAAEQVADSNATQERNQTQGVIPGAAVAQPQLEVNRPLDASKPIDTTPQTMDMVDAAVKKEMILRKLEEGKPGDMSHKTVSTNMGLERPTDQTNA